MIPCPSVRSRFFIRVPASICVHVRVRVRVPARGRGPGRSVSSTGSIFQYLSSFVSIVVFVFVSMYTSVSVSMFVSMPSQVHPGVFVLVCVYVRVLACVNAMTLPVSTLNGASLP